MAKWQRKSGPQSTAINDKQALCGDETALKVGEVDLDLVRFDLETGADSF